LFSVHSKKISMIDYRSDTVTRPTPGMYVAMQNAALGDDVYREDPSVNALQEKAAALFGMEAALFCPSGTMTNQIAIKVHTHPGDEVICSELAHVYQYEGGGMAFNSGVQAKLLPGINGKVGVSQLVAVLHSEDVHKPHTSLVCLENTVNRGGGCCYSLEEITQIREVCEAQRLRLHLDGARLFNALIAKSESPAQYGVLFDSISICLSKGLGCPVGSLLIGSSEFIEQARRVRKVLGGGMRQAGLLAAAGIYALDHHVDRLAEDHRKARQLANVLERKTWVKTLFPVETNILLFEVQGRYTPEQLCHKLKEAGILATAVSASQVRMVVHLDITETMVETTLAALESL
jgi:threonine aldolase